LLRLKGFSSKIFHNFLPNFVKGPYKKVGLNFIHFAQMKVNEC
jgi:hypothetical protein